MKALTFQEKDKVSWTDVPDPILRETTDVIVKVSSCAICGSDLHVYHGREAGIDPGTAMGHEFAGVIEEMGSAVRNFRKGDRVMSPFTTSCGECYYCRAGLTCRCVRGQLFGWVEKGVGLHGGQAEFVRVPLADATLMRVPDALGDEEAILLGDVFSTGYFCAIQTEVKPGGVYAVVGCGPVGLMAILAARELGAEKIFAVDGQQERRAQAHAFGAVALSPTESLDLIQQATEGRGADGVMEAVGNASAIRNAWELVRPGGVVSSVGVCTDPNFSFSPAEAYGKNLTYRVGRCPARHLMEKLLPVVERKTYPLASIFTHRMLLSQGAEGYEIFSGRKDNCLKVLLTPGA